MNSSGKVLVVFLLVISILLLSTTALFVFFFKKEIEKRRSVELSLSESLSRITDMEEEVSKLKKQNLLLKDKNKEADDRINSLLDELDLQEGLRDELKSEILSLKEKVEKQEKVKEQLDEKLAGTVKDFEKKIISLESKLKSAVQEKTSCAQKLQDFQNQNAQLQKRVKDLAKSLEHEKAAAESLRKNKSVAQVVVSPKSSSSESSSSSSSSLGLGGNSSAKALSIKKDFVNGKAGRSVISGSVINVDKPAEFLVIDVGKKNGVRIGMVFSVYRNEKYLGDIKITRLQPEMAAADVLPPLTIRNIHKNDKVILKK